MHPDTRKALEKSIQHWKNNATPGKFEGYFAQNCALCARFNNGEENGLVYCTRTTEYGGEETCPVAEDNGRPECEGSPWYSVSSAAGKFGTDSKEFRHQAQRMVEYLESLLPKD